MINFFKKLFKKTNNAVTGKTIIKSNPFSRLRDFYYHSYSEWKEYIPDYLGIEKTILLPLLCSQVTNFITSTDPEFDKYKITKYDHQVLIFYLLCEMAERSAFLYLSDDAIPQQWHIKSFSDVSGSYIENNTIKDSNCVIVTESELCPKLERMLTSFIKVKTHSNDWNFDIFLLIDEKWLLLQTCGEREMNLYNLEKVKESSKETINAIKNKLFYNVEQSQ